LRGLRSPSIQLCTPTEKCVLVLPLWEDSTFRRDQRGTDPRGPSLFRMRASGALIGSRRPWSARTERPRGRGATMSARRSRRRGLPGKAPAAGAPWSGPSRPQEHNHSSLVGGNARRERTEYRGASRSRVFSGSDLAPRARPHDEPRPQETESVRVRVRARNRERAAQSGNSADSVREADISESIRRATPG